MAAGYQCKLAGLGDEPSQRWCAAIDNVESAIRMISVVAKVDDTKRLTVVQNLSQDDLQKLGLEAGDVQRISKHSVRKPSI
jgi:hypothetical protein